MTDIDPPAEVERVLPNNLEAEQALLGAILLQNDALDQVASFLRPDHFYEPVHGRIYKATVAQIERGRAASPVTLKAYFELDDSLDQVGGDTYLANLVSSVVTVSHAGDYGRVILAAYARREIILRCQAVVEMAWHPEDGDESDIYVSALNQVVDDLSVVSSDHEFVPMGAALRVAAEKAEEAAKQGRIIGATTGLADLDRAIGGLEDGSLTIVAGATSMGKTQLAMVLANNIATNQEDVRPTLFFSMEMPFEQLGARQLSRESGIGLKRLRTGQVTATDDMYATVRAGENTKVWIDDTPSLTVPQMYARARKMRREHGLGLVVIDFLQLIRPEKTYRGNKVAEVGEIAYAVKRMALELKVPVILVSQLRRGLDDRRPSMSDLKESGDIENAADLILLLYRLHYYHPEMPKDVEERMDWERHIDRMDVIIGKQRQGARNVTVPLRYYETTGRIVDITTQQPLGDI